MWRPSSCQHDAVAALNDLSAQGVCELVRLSTINDTHPSEIRLLKGQKPERRIDARGYVRVVAAVSLRLQHGPALACSALHALLRPCLNLSLGDAALTVCCGALRNLRAWRGLGGRALQACRQPSGWSGIGDVSQRPPAAKHCLGCFAVQCGKWRHACAVQQLCD